MRRALSPFPLLVAAALGAVALSAVECFVLKRFSEPDRHAPAATLGAGALVGATVQFGVRLLGIS